MDVSAMVARPFLVWFFRLVLAIPFCTLLVLPKSVFDWAIVQLVIVGWVMVCLFISELLGTRAAERLNEGHLLLESIVGAVTDIRVLLSNLPVVGPHLPFARRPMSGRLGSMRWKEVQTSSRSENDGAVCLANLLEQSGRRASLDDLRLLTLDETGAATGQKIIDAARRYGLKLRGVKVDSKDFDVLLLPAILYWRESSGTFPEGEVVPRPGPGEARFVLLEDIRGDQIVVAFSDVGRRTITLGELLAHATGIVLMPEDC
jgi:hypothetical protein